MSVRFLPCGDTAFSVQFGDVIDRSLNERVVRTKTAIDESGLTGVVETVPSYRALLIYYDPLQTTQAELIKQIEPFLDQSHDASLRGRRWRVPACYDPTFAPDLEYVANWADMSVEKVAEIHTSITHYVYMIGFAPGQPYMGDLPKELAIPRRKDPRPVVEEGSIVTATGFSIIYPITNASGWHIIGRSPVSIFDMEKEPPGLFSAGDMVKFYSVPIAEYHDIKKAVDAGEWELAAMEADQ